MNELLADRRVLVVEDEMLNLMMVQDMLADMGCQSVKAAATVDQAIGLIMADAFDVAMLDMNLDGDDSYAIADELAKRGVPFFFFTGYSDKRMRDDFKSRPVLHKPFAFEELRALFARVLEN